MSRTAKIPQKAQKPQKSLSAAGSAGPSGRPAKYKAKPPTRAGRVKKVKPTWARRYQTRQSSLEQNVKTAHRGKEGKKPVKQPAGAERQCPSVPEFSR